MARGNLATFGYVFTHVPPGPDPERFGAFHTAEVPYVFGMLNAGEREYGTEDRRISDTMMTYWVNFIRSGDPNGPGLAPWPDFRTGNVLWFEAGPMARPALTAEKNAAFREFLSDGGELGIFP